MAGVHPRWIVVTAVLLVSALCDLLYFLMQSLIICSMERTFSGHPFLKCLKYSSSMNSDKSSFQGSCFVFAKPPNFLGFDPSSRAILDVRASERGKHLRASIHGKYFSGIFFFVMRHSFSENGTMSSMKVRVNTSHETFRSNPECSVFSNFLTWESSS